MVWRGCREGYSCVYQMMGGGGGGALGTMRCSIVPSQIHVQPRQWVGVGHVVECLYTCCEFYEQSVGGYISKSLC